jgi:MFS family permease
VAKNSRPVGAQFLRLWIGQGTSAFGTAISYLAIPTIAIIMLGASAAQVGLLQAVQFAAFPLVGLFVGVWVDRWSRRTVMLAADAVRLVGLATIPVAAAMHQLSFVHILVVAGVVGVATVFFDVAYSAFVPVLVDPDKLERANSSLEATYSVARIAGSGLAGGLIAVVGAPVAIAVDAASYLVSVVAIATIRVVEEHRGSGPREPLFPAIRAGIRVITDSPVLAPLSISITLQNLGWAIVAAVQLLFFYRVLHLSVALVGILFALGNIGFIGALLAPAMSRRFGAGPLLVVTGSGVAFAAVLLPLAGAAPVPIIAVSEILMAVCAPAFNVVQVSMRQRLVAPELRGRMTATIRAVVWGTMPLGALLGGALATQYGIMSAMILGAAICCSSIPWLFARPIRILESPQAA